MQNSFYSAGVYVLVVGDITCIWFELIQTIVYFAAVGGPNSPTSISYSHIEPIPLTLTHLGCCISATYSHYLRPTNLLQQRSRSYSATYSHIHIIPTPTPICNNAHAHIQPISIAHAQTTIIESNQPTIGMCIWFELNLQIRPFQYLGGQNSPTSLNQPTITLTLTLTLKTTTNLQLLEYVQHIHTYLCFSTEQAEA